MNLWDKIKNSNIIFSTTKTKERKKLSETYAARYKANEMAKAMQLFFGKAFGGQTRSGAMSYPDITTLDYYTLRERSWKAMARDELASAIVRRLVKFSIGTGLKLQAEPMFRLLTRLNINFGNEQKQKEFVEFIEDLFKINSRSKVLSDIAKEKTLHKLAATAFYNALIGGDVLIINRIVDGVSKIQIIDGANICDPGLLSGIISMKEVLIKDADGKKKTRKIKEGNRIIDGVEIDNTGAHVGYYISQMTDKPFYDGDDKKKSEESFTAVPVFVPAYGEKTGRRMAWLLYGSEYRLGETRGMPMLGVVLERAELLRRYARAEVMNAELSAKILTFIEHGSSSTGLNPLRPKTIRNSSTVISPEYDGTSSLNGDKIAKNFAETTGGVMINLGKDQKVNKFDTSRPPANFGQFYDSNARYICAALDVPWEVALMVFTNNFSASRMAAKLFEGGALVCWRQEVSDNFYKPYYDSFFMLMALQYNIFLPGYLQALIGGNEVILAAYTNARFIGKALPHVDPLKEANTIKVLKEINGRSMSAMVEETYGEDYGDTLSLIQKEQENVKAKGVEAPVITPQNNGNNGDVEDPDNPDEPKKK